MNMKKILRINAKDPHLRGLMSYLLQVLNNLKWSDENEYTPLVDLCGPSYWLHDKEYGDNIWEYFFAPVSDITLTPTEEEIEKYLPYLKNQELNTGAAACACISHQRRC